MGYLTQKQVAERLEGKASNSSLVWHVSDGGSFLWIFYLIAARAAIRCPQVGEQDTMTAFPDTMTHICAHKDWKHTQGLHRFKLEQVLAWRGGS